MFDIIMSCASKTCSLDCMPTWLLKSNIDVVVPYVKDIVNMSLRDGVFPLSLKQAIVTPIIKKTTLDWNELKNYRPVSNISFIGKVIEKAVISQFNEHMEKNDLNEVFQSAYKNKHSTETALLKVKDDITRALDKNHAAFLIMLDLSAAFDTIDHGILFHQFEPLATSSPQHQIPSKSTCHNKSVRFVVSQENNDNNGRILIPDRTVNTNKSSEFKRPYKPLKALVINFQSMKGKVAEILTCLEVDDPDLIIGSETWLDSSISSSEIMPSGYTVFRKDRPVTSKKGITWGGVCIAIKSNIICHHRSDLDSDSEILWIEINITGTKPILVGSFYRPPNSDRDYLGNLRISLEKINQSKFSNIWLAGDFNCGDIVWETQSVLPGSNKAAICRDLIDITNDYGFEQVVEGPTRGKKTLELFFITNPTLVVKSSLLPGISDHDGIPVLLLNSKPSTTKQKPRKVYLYNKADTTELKAEVLGISSDFKEKELSNTTVNELWIELRDRLKSAVDTHVPSKVVRKRNFTPWITKSIKRWLKRKQRAYNKARKSGKSEDWENFRHIRNKVKKATRKAYRKFIRNNSLASVKQFWSFIKSLKKDSTGIPALKDSHKSELVTDSKGKAELLNMQYQSQFTQERMSDLPTESESEIPSMPDIIIREEGVSKLLKNLNPHKAAGPDDISP